MGRALMNDQGDSVVLTVTVPTSIAEARARARAAGASSRDVGFTVDGTTGATLIVARSVRGVALVRAMLAQGQATQVEDLARATTSSHTMVAVRGAQRG